jgi:hypothetical protein
MKQKVLPLFIANDRIPLKDDLLVNLTIHDIPSVLLKEFCTKVANPEYPGGISDAIKDLMWKAIEAQNQQEDAR